MRKLYNLLFVIAFIFSFASTCYGSTMFPPDKVKIIHQNILDGAYKKCLTLGQNSTTCDCISEMVSNNLNDDALINCSSNDRATLTTCMYNFMGKIRGILNTNTLAICAKNPTSAGVNPTVTATPSGISFKLRILLLAASILIGVLIFKSKIFKS